MQSRGQHGIRAVKLTKNSLQLSGMRIEDYFIRHNNNETTTEHYR